MSTKRKRKKKKQIVSKKEHSQNQHPKWEVIKDVLVSGKHYECDRVYGDIAIDPIERPESDEPNVWNKILDEKNSIFRLLERGNRKIRRDKIKRIKKKMAVKNILFIEPVLTVAKNNKLYVFDGQHRLISALELGGDIYYRVIPSSYGVSVGDINREKTNLNGEDFLKIHCDNDEPEYLKFESLWKEYPNIKFSLLQDILKHSGGSDRKTEEWADGNWRYPENDSLARRVLSQVVELSPLFETPFYRNMIWTLCDVNQTKGYSYSRMRKKIVALHRRDKGKFTKYTDNGKVFACKDKGQEHFFSLFTYAYGYKPEEDEETLLFNAIPKKVFQQKKKK